MDPGPWFQFDQSYQYVLCGEYCLHHSHTTPFKSCNFILKVKKRAAGIRLPVQGEKIWKGKVKGKGKRKGEGEADEVPGSAPGRNNFCLAFCRSMSTPSNWSKNVRNDAVSYWCVGAETLGSFCIQVARDDH
jgi:hypothetical protein